MHTAPYFTALGLLVVYLSARVVVRRGRHKVSLGDGGVADLHHSVRAFGNLVEYAPLGLVLLFALEYVQAPVWFLHLCGLTLLAGRLLHAFAFSKPEIIFKLRAGGMILTWISLGLSSIGLTVFSMMALRP